MDQIYLQTKAVIEELCEKAKLFEFFMYKPHFILITKFTTLLGRYLLASSHAGTRLPIATIQDSGRSPSIRFSFLNGMKKQEDTVCGILLQ